ncbi:hypothetical protein BCR32DRAFT_269819 [Anaeromyces robustus]|uniref:Uncharacterized protein n=1 Tax=Anaeromyces robustus TaxID=1754192 RepID=A0A1Y1WZD1_9FUNG|nr:hypothetical protein BCR32DRAFT_269819 [Anaeromyces robustus]|eukprot:ORX78863.1 hypothetical protein BCR32DRAFT_269819 [Anaeromyces robustus]
MNLNIKKNLYSSNLYSNSEILSSINEINNNKDNNGLSKLIHDNSSPDTSQTLSKRNSSPLIYHSTNTTTTANSATSSSATATMKSQPNESLSTSSSPSNATTATTSSSSNSMTTFIPKVGWCIKTYGKFSIFFVDGTNIILESRKPNQLQYLNYQDANYKKHIIYYLDQPIPKDVKQKLSYIFKFRELMKSNTN